MIKMKCIRRSVIAAFFFAVLASSVRADEFGATVKRVAGGAQLVSSEPKGLASQLGLKEKWVIAKINGKAVHTQSEVTGAIRFQRHLKIDCHSARQQWTVTAEVFWPKEVSKGAKRNVLPERDGRPPVVLSKKLTEKTKKASGK